MLHIIQETQNPAKRAILPEKSESSTIFHHTLPENKHSHILHNSFTIFCANRLNILYKSFPYFAEILSGFLGCFCGRCLAGGETDYKRWAAWEGMAESLSDFSKDFFKNILKKYFLNILKNMF